MASKPTYRVTWGDLMLSMDELGADHGALIRLEMRPSAVTTDTIVASFNVYDYDQPYPCKPVWTGCFTYAVRNEHSWPAFMMRDLWTLMQDYGGQPWFWGPCKRRMCVSSE